MSVQPIRLFGDPVLRTPAEPVVDFDKELRTLVKDLQETMHNLFGIIRNADELAEAREHIEQLKVRAEAAST